MDLLKLNWIDEEIEFVDRETFNKTLFNCRKSSHLKNIPNVICRRCGFFYNTFQNLTFQTSGELRICDVKNNLTKRMKYMNSQLEIDSQNDGITGSYCFERVNDLFVEKNQISIFKAFSGLKYKELYFQLKKCVPKQPHFAKMTEVVESSGFKADVSSAFPFQASKSLPTLHGSKLIEGRVDPSEEYPFAFYLKSHHLKIFNELDSKTFDNRFYFRYYNDVYNDFIPDQFEKTLLCKKSEFSLKDILFDLYSKRKLFPENKKIMNAFIGVMHYNANPQLAHLAVVIIARCVKDMIERAEKIENEGGKVFLISTDSILWKGSESSVVDYEKKMGAFCYENKNIRFCVRSTNCYQIENESGFVETKFSGKSESFRKNMKLGEILKLSDVEIELKEIFKKDGYFLTKEELEIYEKEKEKLFERSAGEN